MSSGCDTRRPAFTPASEAPLRLPDISSAPSFSRVASSSSTNRRAPAEDVAEARLRHRGLRHRSIRDGESPLLLPPSSSLTHRRARSRTKPLTTRDAVLKMVRPHVYSCHGFSEENWTTRARKTSCNASSGVVPRMHAAVALISGLRVRCATVHHPPAGCTLCLAGAFSFHGSSCSSSTFVGNATTMLMQRRRCSERGDRHTCRRRS